MSNKNDQSKAVKWAQAFSQGFSNSGQAAEPGVEIATKIKAKGDKALEKIDANIDFVENPPNKKPTPRARTPRAKAASAPPPPPPQPAESAPAPKSAPRAKAASTSGSAKSMRAFEQFHTYRRYKRYVKLCRKREIELPSGIGALSAETSTAELEKAIGAIQAEFDSASGEDSIKSDVALGLSFVEMGIMHKSIFGRLHNFNLHGLSAAVEKNWDIFKEEAEEILLKYDFLFDRPVEVRFFGKLMILCKTLHDYNTAGSAFQEAYDSGNIALPDDFPRQ